MPATRRAEHTEDTRAALLAAARDLFTERGYAGTGTEQIVQRARLTRGALYHHFSSKEDLFRTLLQEVEAELIDRLVGEGAPGADLLEQFRNGCQKFLDASLEPTVNRIMLVDGPAVLGWETWREIELAYGFGLLREYLELVIESGLVPDQPVDPLAHLLVGAINEAAMLIAHADDPAVAREQAGRALDRLLLGLRR
jgi:AcrR family transcriptional regulator